MKVCLIVYERSRYVTSEGYDVEDDADGASSAGLTAMPMPPLE